MTTTLLGGGSETRTSFGAGLEMRTSFVGGSETRTLFRGGLEESGSDNVVTAFSTRQFSDAAKEVFELDVALSRLVAPKGVSNNARGLSETTESIKGRKLCPCELDCMSCPLRALARFKRIVCVPSIASNWCAVTVSGFDRPSLPPTSRSKMLAGAFTCVPLSISNEPSINSSAAPLGIESFDADVVSSNLRLGAPDRTCTSLLLMLSFFWRLSDSNVSPDWAIFALFLLSLSNKFLSTSLSLSKLVEVGMPLVVARMEIPDEGLLF